VDFAEATDRLGMTASEVADALGLQTQTVKQMRMRPSSAGYRNPPAGWERVLSQMARKRSRELARLADDLARLAG
jgi:hypothetical protein